MTMQNSAPLIDAAQTWETDELVRVRRASRIWQFFALGSLVVAGAACVAVALLTPLKTVEPIVIRVDKSTGSADIITRVDERTVSFNEVLDKYWLSRYVNYREEYSNAEAYGNYQAVSIMSTRDVGEAYYAQINPRNPKAPVNVYGKEGQVEIVVNSIAFLSQGVAQVRFVRLEKAGSSPPRESHWIATIGYRYLTAPMKEKDRLVNPVGFQCNEYRLDSENVPTGS